MDFTAPHFAEPFRLWAIPFAGVLFTALFWHAAKSRRKALATVASAAMIGRLLQGHSPARRVFKNGVFVVAAVLILLAIARPCWGVSATRQMQDAEDIVFLLDTSRSMTARDVAPSRLERAKRAIDTFVGTHRSGRVGIVAFAGEAFLQCPPTADRDIFRDTLDALDTEVIPTPGTDIGAALTEGNAAFGDRKGRRTLVMLTDGEDLSGRGVDIAKNIRKEGVVVHTVGIGGAGYEISSRQGGTETTRLDETTLKDIASATGGEYFRLGGANDTFAAVETRLERTVSASGEERTPIARQAIPLALAALLLAAEALVGTRRKLPVGALAKAAALLLVTGLSIHTAHAESPERLYDLGADALRREQFHESEDYLKNSLAVCDDTLRPRALHNLGQARSRSAVRALDKRESPLEKLGKLNSSATLPSYDIDAVLNDNATQGKLDEQAANKAIGAARAVRKEIKKQLPDLRKTTAEGEALAKSLERGRDDFLGANELNPADTDAKKNAGAIDAYLKKLKSKLEEEKASADAAQKADRELKEKIKRLKREMKKQSGQPQQGEGEEDEDEDGDDKDKDKQQQKGPDNRTEEQRRKDEGREGRMNREESQAALEAMRDDMRRKVQFGKRPDPEAVKRARETGNDR